MPSPADTDSGALDSFDLPKDRPTVVITMRSHAEVLAVADLYEQTVKGSSEFRSRGAGIVFKIADTALLIEFASDDSVRQEYCYLSQQLDLSASSVRAELYTGTS